MATVMANVRMMSGGERIDTTQSHYVAPMRSPQL